MHITVGLTLMKDRVKDSTSHFPKYGLFLFYRTVVGYKNTWLTGINFSANMSYKVFCGWDFCIREPDAAVLKHNLIRNELKVSS